MSLYILLWFFSLTGLGSLILTFTGWRADESMRIPAAALTGLIGLTALSLLANFFIPITPAVAAVFFAVGIAAFLWKLSNHLQAASPFHIAGLGAAALLAHYISSGVTAFPLDTAVYHLQAVQWIEKSRLVYGLANVEGKLGFNSVWFPAAAALGIPGMVSKGAFAVGGLLFLIYCSFLQSALFSHPKNTERPLAALFLLAGFFPVVFEFLYRRHTAEPSTDAPVMLLSLTAVYLFLNAVEKQRLKADAGLILITALFVLCVKLSAVMITVPLTLLLFLFSAAAKDKSAGPGLPILGIILLALWCLRGIALSGCLFFPAPAGCFANLAWTVPEQVLQGETEVIRFWARKPFFAPDDAALAGWNWIKPWFAKMIEDSGIRLSAASAFAGTLLLLVPAKPGKSQPLLKKAVAAVFTILGAGIVFWFLSAPDPRFGLAYTGGLAALLLACGLKRFFRNRNPAESQTVLLFVLLIALLPAAAGMRPLNAASWDWPAVPKAAWREEVNAHGTRIRVPEQNMLCWNTPVPCAPFLRSGLKASPSSSSLEIPERYFFIAEPGPSV